MLTPSLAFDTVRLHQSAFCTRPPRSNSRACLPALFGATWGDALRGQMTYEDYISSDNWRRKRDERLLIDRRQCRTCTSCEDLEVHHRHYDNLFDEQMDDLITLCRECHHAITSVVRSRRYNSRQMVPSEIHAPQKRSFHCEYSATEDDMDGIGPVDLAQRSIVRPTFQVGQGIEKGYVEEIEDRRGLRSYGSH